MSDSLQGNLAFEALLRADRLVAQKVPYEQFVAALDRCRELPGADAVLAGIAQRRLGITSLYQRDIGETEQALEWLLQVTPDPIARASSAIPSCIRFPELARRYLPTIVAELERLASAPPELLRRSREVLESART